MSLEQSAYSQALTAAIAVNPEELIQSSNLVGRHLSSYRWILGGSLLPDA